jgi:thiol-disulfide isomerase/thioredoxin
MILKRTTDPDAGAEPDVRLARDTYSVGSAIGAIGFAAVACVLSGAGLLPPSSSSDEGVLIRNLATAQAQEAFMDTRAKTGTETAQRLAGPLRSLLDAPQWLNGPLRSEDLQGKVVLVNFWTYSCINSLRPLPYLRAWAEKYKDRGLVVIGVHAPEFAFEHDLTKVRRAAAELPVGYPVVLDNDYGIWRAFNNQAWPGFYFFDAKGHLRNRVMGEGGYDLSERWIQKLLSEASGTPVVDQAVEPGGVGAQAPPDWTSLRSAETYVGSARSENLSSPGGVKRNTSTHYRAASRLPPDHWSLAGDWTIRGEYATVDEASGKIAYRFHARDLHLVLGREPGGDPIRFRVTIDGKPPGADHGADVDAEGWGSLDQDRMYQLVRQAGRVTDRTFEIEFLSLGARAYSFTFG